MADNTSTFTRDRKRNQWSLRSLIVATVFFAIYSAIVAADGAGLSDILCTMLVAYGSILLSRRWQQLSPLRAAVIGVIAATIHCGAYAGAYRAYYFLDLSSSRSWSAWQTGGGWPTVVGYTLSGMAVGLLSGVIVATAYGIIFRIVLTRSR